MRKISNLSGRVLYRSGQLVTSASHITASFIQLNATGWALLLAVMLICLPAADIRETIKTTGDVIALLRNTLWLSTVISLNVVLFREFCRHTL
ncbi:hypothetical protein NG99_07125 [Erwinia typographi]|uniref:Uncharacterized protein n=1 Tax=Erwinia typographi TaxID=371042 RepID=A0A0A3ZAU2_9GAMM|nr:hypothetical protein [Erwinia typographi]KGT94756.1 hypothetical protein NG99_07125 [Erwinia typographi]